MGQSYYFLLSFCFGYSLTVSIFDCVVVTGDSENEKWVVTVSSLWCVVQVECKRIQKLFVAKSSCLFCLLIDRDENDD